MLLLFVIVLMLLLLFDEEFLFDFEEFVEKGERNGEHEQKEEHAHGEQKKRLVVREPIELTAAVDIGVFAVVD